MLLQGTESLQLLNVLSQLTCVFHGTVKPLGVHRKKLVQKEHKMLFG